MSFNSIIPRGISVTSVTTDINNKEGRVRVVQEKLFGPEELGLQLLDGRKKRKMSLKHGNTSSMGFVNEITFAGPTSHQWRLWAHLMDIE